MNHSETVKLLDELATIIPDLISDAKELSIDYSEHKSFKLVIRTHLSEGQKFSFLYNFCGRGLSLIERSSGIWVIC